MFIRVGDHDNADPDDTKFNKKQTFGVKKIVMHPGEGCSGWIQA